MYLVLFFFFFFGFSHKTQKWYSPLISWFSSLLSPSHQCISLLPSARALTFVSRSLGLSGRIVFLHLSHPFFKSYSFWFLIPPFRVHPAMVIHFSFIGTLTAFLFFSGLLYIPSDMASCISSNILHCLVQFFLLMLKVSYCGSFIFFLLCGILCHRGNSPCPYQPKH